MVIDQLPIFDLSTSTAETAAPRCRMCARPARWLTTQQHYAMYCAGKQCSNRERICQACGSPFVMSVDGAGTKYCSTECKAAGYNIAKAKPKDACAWCGKPNDDRHHRTSSWPYICAPCLRPIRHVLDRLKAHHVSHERARQLLVDPGCEICGRDLLEKIKDREATTPRAPLVVDHDHTCCPVTHHSCGLCVRGLICRYCNTALGMLGDNADVAQSASDYLRKHR